MFSAYHFVTGDSHLTVITVSVYQQSEKSKQLLYQAKYGRFGLGDPFFAIQRDSDGVKDTSFDEAAVKNMYEDQLSQLEHLIAVQRQAQVKLRDQMKNAEGKYHKVRGFVFSLRYRLKCFRL